MSETGLRLRPWILTGYFVAVVILGALIAPLFWWLGMWLIEQSWIQGNEFLHENLRKSEFDRYFRRAVLLAALLLFWPAWKALGAKRAEWQLPKREGGWREGLLGFFLAGGILLLMGWGQLALGAYDWREAGETLRWSRLGEALLSGIAVGVLEEWVFRAVLFGLLLGALTTWKAAAFVTILFAVLHFFVPPEQLMLVPEGHYKLAAGKNTSDLPNAQIQWWTGLWLAKITLANVGQLEWWKLLAAELGTLLAVGVVVVVARLRTRSLWLSIGLHAGWVTGLKWFAASTHGSDSLKAGQWLPWVGENLRVGLMPCLIVLLTGVLALWLAPMLGAVSGDKHSQNASKKDG